MNRTSRGIGLAIVAALALPAAAGALDVIDDWRKVGPPDVGDRPAARGTLAPAAADELVAALDRTWRSGTALRARGDQLEWVVDNLRYAFLPASGLPAPPTMGERDEIERNRDRIRRIDLLGRRSGRSHDLLLVVAHVAYEIYEGTYDPVALAVVLGRDGRVTDLAVLNHDFGDACYSAHRGYRVEPQWLRVVHEVQHEGVLCADAAPDDDCCSVSQGATTELEVGTDGRFQARVRRLTLTGQFADAKTGEELRIEDSGEKALRIGYRAKAKTPWKALQIVSSDRKLGVVVAKFPKSAVTYTLTIAEDGRSLVSAGSDGSKAQRFGLLTVEQVRERAP